MSPHEHDADCICDECVWTAVHTVTQAQQTQDDQDDRFALRAFAIVMFGYLLLETLFLSHREARKEVRHALESRHAAIELRNAH